MFVWGGGYGFDGFVEVNGVRGVFIVNGLPADSHALVL